MDSAHFVHSVFVGFVWCVARVFIQSASGRKRLNVLGALDAHSKELFTITNQTYINSQTVCQMLEKLAAHYGKQALVIVLDNARYQKCKLVIQKAEELGIKLLYLPPYSPNLNLIERVWKFVKNEVLYSQYYADFDSFKTSIENCLGEINQSKKSRMDSLLTLKSQKLPTPTNLMAA